MADVFTRRTLTRGLGLLVLVKAVDYAWRAPAVVDWWPLLVAAWIVAGVGLWKTQAWALPSLAGLSVVVWMVEPLRNQHLYLFFFLAVLIWVDPPTLTLRWALRMQVSVVYGFAALGKITEDWLSGAVLERQFATRPFGQIVGIPDDLLVPVVVAALVVEGALAVAVWFPRTLWMPVVFHVGLVVTMADSPIHAVQLVVFGGLMVLMWWGSQRQVGVVDPQIVEGEQVRIRTLH